LQNPPQSQSTDPVGHIVHFVTSWEAAKMWPFSCFGNPHWPSLPELADISPEELRLDAYQSRTGPAVWSAEHLAKMASLAQEYSAKRQAIKQPNAAVLEALKQYVAQNQHLRPSAQQKAPAATTGGGLVAPRRSGGLFGEAPTAFASSAGGAAGGLFSGAQTSVSSTPGGLFSGAQTQAPRSG
uniref:NUP50 domain-containing protein n=1 Tax=Macrostomum lignano TaxID=282301 RepID=A0A1I8HFJ8_9PLAT